MENYTSLLRRSEITVMWNWKWKLILIECIRCHYIAFLTNGNREQQTLLEELIVWVTSMVAERCHINFQIEINTFQKRNTNVFQNFKTPFISINFQMRWESREKLPSNFYFIFIVLILIFNFYFCIGRKLP